MEKYIGWRLDEAKADLAEDESTLGLPIRLIETVPTRKKIDYEIDRFGDWRVLRSRVVENEIELTVAREQLVD